MKKIIYRTNEFYKRKPLPLFSEVEDEYTLDEEKDELVKTGTINLQERIQSNEDCALSKILDKYLKTDDIAALDKLKVEVDDSNQMYENHRPDLADLGAEYERVEKLKVKYGLDPDLSYADTLKALQVEKSKLDAYVLKLQKEKENEEKKAKLQEEQKNV